MKRKGNINIITDGDIIVTGKSNAGNNLDTVVEKLSEDIYDLKSQLKWTHKYGAVGSGSGGGSTTKWSVIATLDGQNINAGNTISLSNGVSTYPLKIAVSGGSASYYVTYSYAGTQKQVELSAENKWRLDTTIALSTNGVVSIEVTDNVQVKTVYATYVVFPFSFSDLKLVRNVDHGLTPYASNDIYIETAAVEGLYVKLDYEITVNAECTYSWAFLNEEPVTGEITNKDGYIIFQIPEKYITDEYANSYNVNLTLRITPENQNTQVITKTVTFNLIPAKIYMKLTPQVGLVYDEEISEDDAYKYSINREIAFDCRVYQGTNQSRACTIRYWKDDDEQDAQELNGTEGETYTLRVSYGTPGWHKVTFSYNIGTSRGVTEKYLYCKQVSSAYNWFKPSISPSKESFYKGYEDIKVSNLEETITTPYIQLYRSNESIESFHFLNPPTEINNLLINIGIQYNEINNVAEPICVIRSNEEVSTNEFITVYQNKIVFSGVFGGSPKDCNFFLHKESSYDPGNPDKYHLITIAIAPVYHDESTNQTYYEYNVYVDGVLEGAINVWPIAVKILGSIDFRPGNYAINHFSADYFTGVAGVSEVHDSDINYYYYTYEIKSRNDSEAVSERDTNILNFLYDSSTNKINYYMDHDLVHVESTLYDNIAKNIDIPTLVARVPKIQQTIPGSPSIFDWMNSQYEQDSTDVKAKAKIPISQLRWGRNRSETAVISIPSTFSNYYFYLKLQGSSTMNNKSKNFTLGLETSDTGDPTTLLFSPNYERHDSSTFLHETEFNLKADVVDSAHTNNVAMGKFINENNNFEYSMGTQHGDADIMAHVRQCLDGFPILMYLEVVDGDKVDVYYLGVYSFNLGRESYFNLGYCDLSQLSADYIADTSNTTFSFTTVGSGTQRGLNPLEGFVAAEVQDSRKYWDFSQYDDTILFQQNNESSNFMFGDIVTYAGNTDAKNSIKNFVHSVSLGGGYLFREMGKEFEPVNDPENPDDESIAYHTIGVVPDYKVQYRRNGTTYTQKGDIIPPARYEDLFNCIGGVVDGELVKGRLNYNSLAYYYATCMAFGLIDSVQKNTNVKTWDNTEFGLFFYDMDTCLGRDNDGNPSSYFSFSDYWESDIKEYDEDGNLIDRTRPEDVNKIAATTINNGVTVYRDYFPIGTNIIGYDIPSSYLFAVAKYAKALSSYSEQASFLAPQTIYGNWRTVGGPLQTAEIFIQKYYAPNLAGVPSCMLNLNYRNKYLYYQETVIDESSTGRTGFSNISKYLFGKGVEVTTEWLKGRLHILDAYFNMEGANIIIHSGSTTYMEPIRTTPGLNNNQDIVIMKDIFQSGTDPWRRKQSSLEFTVKAPAYTPLIIRGSTSLSQFLLEKENVPYTIRTSFGSVQPSIFGGSQLWTDLDSINTFVDSSSSTNAVPLYINNKYLEAINGTTGSYAGGFSFVLPAVKSIVMNSAGYSGALSIDDSFYNLSTIDISKSAISLNVDGSRVTSIDARNINSSSLVLTNCNNLQTVYLSGAAIASCDIRPAWTKNIDLSGNRIKSLSVAGKLEGGSYGALTISNNGTITDVDFSRFSTVTISNCSAVKSVVQSDNTTNLTSLTINNCTALTSLTVYVDKLTDLNLSGCTNLSSLTLKGTDFTKLTKLNLYRTKVAYITYDSGTDTTCLDLSRFTNLGTSTNSSVTYVRLDDNSEVQEIQFRNSQTSPMYLVYTLQNCTKLRRVYGNVSVYVAKCFYGLRNFSVHGSDLSSATWHGASILNGTKVKHPKDITNNYFSSGNKVTNITFGISNSSAAFYQTNCTLFDYYYILSNLGNGTTLNSMFAYPQNTTYGFFNIENGNNPDLRLFADCANITSVYFCFGYNAGGHKIYLQSPTVVNGTVTADDGLFSPLVNCDDFGGVFYSYTYVLDKYLFRRFSNNYIARYMNYFNPSYILNNPPTDFSWATIITIYSDLKNNTGDLSGFFNNLQNLREINGFIGGVNYIDYSKNFKIPSGVTTIASAFRSAYAYSENFVLADFFVSPANVQYLRQSFIMTNAPTQDYYVNMELNNNTFSSFTNIIEIGYGGTRSWGSTDYFTGCFTGFNKTIAEQFPTNIFINNTKATRLSGIFMNATSAYTYNDLELPGNMFEHNTRLEDVSAIFYNIGVSYRLSSGVNFRNCPNISKLDYAFAEVPTNSKLPALSGSIPYKFFWHGESVATKTYYGTNEREEILDDHGQVIGYDYINVQPYTVVTKTVRNQIASMKYCFQHSNLSAYSNNDIDDYVEGNPNYAPYLYYSESESGPFTVNTNVDTRQYTFIWVFDGYHFPSSYTSLTKDNFEILDNTVSNTAAELITDCTYENVIVDTGGGIGEAGTAVNTYLAPPDLLRYCKNNCDIYGLFAYSGVQNWNYHWNGAGGYNQYGYGLKGRICPYMLKPVPNVTSIQDMFRCCKLLSYYRHDYVHGGRAYMIPEGFFSYAPKITDLTSAFEDTMQPQISELSTIFAPLTGTLKLQRLFYGSYWDGGKYPGTYTELSEVFDKHEVSSTEKAFCITTVPAGMSEDRVRNQMIKFSKMFDSKYSRSVYEGNVNYSDTFRGYTKLGSGTDNERFGVKTLVDDDRTNNYTL